MIPSQDYHRTSVVVPAKLHEGLDREVHRLVGWFRRRPTLRFGLMRRARRALDAASRLAGRPDAELARLVADNQAYFRRNPRPSGEAVEHGMALVIQISERTLGLRPHPVQVLGALAMHAGFLIEMATGEGKSLTAALSAALYGWSGKPTHVITVNEYLAARDAEEFHHFYKSCGLTVACVKQEMDPPRSSIAYAADVVYATSHQLLADFLRDRLVLGAMQDGNRRVIRALLGESVDRGGQLVLRGIHSVIVDEADSVLIDEAVTPLIISRSSENRPLVEASQNAARVASSLVKGLHYKIDERYRELDITPLGHDAIEQAVHELGGIWRGSPRRTELVTQALVAREHYERDKQFVVREGEIVIVDEYTGRLMPDRKWSHGLHQAVEAKEGLQVTSPAETMARLSFQRFFRMFRNLAGMSGTIREVSDELWAIYELPVLSVPTHRRCLRRELSDRRFADEERKAAAIVTDVTELNRQGRPVLVGTRSVRASEQLAERLAAAGLPAVVLNATRHEEEAHIIARAGERGRITIATNMAGRGTDIKLAPGVREIGGLHVIASERNESRRIDRQLFGRSARQGDPGSARAYLSPDDEMIERYTSAPVRRAVRTALKFQLPGAGLALERLMVRAQSVAQADAFKQRRGVLKVDEWLEDALSFTDRSRSV